MSGSQRKHERVTPVKDVKNKYILLKKIKTVPIKPRTVHLYYPKSANEMFCCWSKYFSSKKQVLMTYCDNIFTDN